MNHDNILAYLKVGFDCLAPIKIWGDECGVQDYIDDILS